MGRLKKFLMVYIGVIFAFIITSILGIETAKPGVTAIEMFLGDGVFFASWTLLSFVISLFL